MKYLQKIEGTTKGLSTKIDITLNGRNLIITGQNGVGKTFFLNQVNNTITKELLSKIASISEESFKAKKNFMIRLNSILDQNPQLYSVIASIELKKLNNLSKNKNDFNVENNNKFYKLAKKILDDIYYFNKSYSNNRNRFLHNIESNNIFLNQIIILII